MMYMVVEPARETIRTIDCKEFDDALREAALSRGKVDHGQIDRRHGYCVFEFGLFLRPDRQHYSVIHGRLIAGNILIYGIGDRGETVDVDRYGVPEFGMTFLHGRFDVEAAIEVGMTERPDMRRNGEVIWRWPEPVPFDFPKE